MNVLRVARLALHEEVDDQEAVALVRRTGLARSEAVLSSALSQLDEAPIFTIHGFCQRALGDFALETGQRFEMSVSAELDALLQEITCDLWHEIRRDAPAVVLGNDPPELGLEKLQELSRLAAIWPEFELPEGAPSSLEEDVFRFRVLREDAFRQWRARRAELVRELLSSDLKQTSYKRERVVKSAEALDEFLSRRDLRLGLHDGVSRFGAMAIAKGTKKGKTSPRDGFFELIDELLETRERLVEGLGAWIVVAQRRFVFTFA